MIKSTSATSAPHLALPQTKRESHGPPASIRMVRRCLQDRPDLVTVYGYTDST